MYTNDDFNTYYFTKNNATYEIQARDYQEALQIFELTY